MNPNTILKNIKNWSAIIDKKDALTRLIQGGISPRNAEKMLAGTYRHRIRQSTIDALIKAGVL